MGTKTVTDEKYVKYRVDNIQEQLDKIKESIIW